MVPSRGVVVSMFMRIMAVARYRFIAGLCIIFITVWCCCALLVYFFEMGANPRIHGPVETIYFLLVTMMTSGYTALEPQRLPIDHGPA